MPTLPPHPAVPVINCDFPPAFGVDSLSILLGQATSTIYANRSRAPHKIPPACTPPGTRNPVWLLTDVLDWLARHREPVPAPPPSNPRATPAPNSLRRRPTKIEEEDARLAGFVGEGAVTAHRAALRAAAQEGGTA